MNQMDTALLTVTQAAAKWCPEARAMTPYDGQNISTNDNTICIGDQCAFWRWHDAGDRTQQHVETAPGRQFLSTGYGDETMETTRPKPDDGQAWEYDDEEGLWYVPAPNLPPRGYCGKAGHPHQARLLDMQMELLAHQIRIARYDV